MDALSILLVGDARRDEFREARDFLATATRLSSAPNITAAMQLLARGETSPEIIVLAAAWPGEFVASQVDRLRQAAPLARLVSLVGSWCEGETRTGHPWPSVPRIYAHQFVPRFGAELERLASGAAPTWSLPVTATEDERLLGAVDAPHPMEQRHGVIGIAARDAEAADALRDALRSRGYSTCRISATNNGRRTTDTLRAAIWDGRGGDASEIAALRRFAERQTAPVIALLDFPRAADRQRTLEAGAAAVVSKPLLLGDLFWQLDRLM